MKDPCGVLGPFAHTEVLDGVVKNPVWCDCPFIENCEHWLKKTIRP